MASHLSKQGHIPRLPDRPEFANAADKTGLWFAAAVLFAVLAAGVIVYRTGGADIRTAANDTVTAQTGPTGAGPVLSVR
jgi:hypothetical protein